MRLVVTIDSVDEDRDPFGNHGRPVRYVSVITEDLGGTPPGSAPPRERGSGSEGELNPAVASRVGSPATARSTGASRREYRGHQFFGQICRRRRIIRGADPPSQLDRL
jgi:hypothetical protein